MNNLLMWKCVLLLEMCTDLPTKLVKSMIGKSVFFIIINVEMYLFTTGYINNNDQMITLPLRAFSPNHIRLSVK